MMDWIQKAQPPIVILENVVGAPWEKKVQAFQEMDYEATYDSRLDTKMYYIPHTRQRGYLVAVKKASSSSSSNNNNDPNKKKKFGPVKIGQWKELVHNQLSRPASGALDAFMLPNEDPRVLRGRARLSAGKSVSSENRVDWGKCELRHLYARASEELGDKRPLTGW
jgi:site-specific DNA-cytosine methylase